MKFVLAARAIIAALFMAATSPSIYAADITGVALIKTETKLLRIQQEPNTKSPVIGTYTVSADDQLPKITDPKGEPLFIPEYGYERLGFPVLEAKPGWYKVGLSKQDVSGFPESFALSGWVAASGATSAVEFQTVGAFLKDSMVEIETWDQMLYREPGGKEKIKVSYPSLKMLGTVRLKPGAFKSGAGVCEIPFYADNQGRKLIGICPQNFSFVHGAECEPPVNGPSLGTPEAVFCKKLYVLDETDRFYKVAFTSDLMRFRKDQLAPGALHTDPEFGFYDGWVDKNRFDKITPMTAVAHQSAQNAVIGRELQNIRGVEVLEVKNVGPDEWLHVKIKEHCSSDEKTYGEGWLPVRVKGKIAFSFVSRGC